MAKQKFQEDYYMNNKSSVHDLGNFMILPHTFVTVLGLKEAYVLAYLIQFAAWQEEQADGFDDGWFACSVARLNNKLQISVEQQRRVMHSLMEQGILEVAMKSNPAKRFIRIHFDVLQIIMNRGLQSKQLID